MAKTALNKDLFREIWRTKNRFISIVLLVMIAVAFLSGLRLASPDMQASMDAYFDDQNLMDAEIKSTLGLTADDVSAVSKQPGIAVAEGAYTVDAVASNGDDSTMVVKALSLSEQNVNVPVLLRGRMPRGAGECLVEEKLCENIGVSLGDTIYLDTGDGVFENVLTRAAFTVAGVAKSPLYASISRGNSTLGNGSAGAFVLLRPEVYQMDYFTDIYVVAQGGKELNAYGEDYKDLSAVLTAQLESIQKEREAARTAQVKGEAQRELADGRRDYETAADQAYAALAAAWEQLQNAAAELNRGKAAYQSGVAQLEEGKDAVAQGYRQLNDSKTSLEAGESAYRDGAAQTAAAEQSYLEGQNRYDEGYRQYQEGAALYQEQTAAYESSLAAYEENQAAYEQNRAAYDSDAARWQETAAALAAERRELLASGMDESEVNAVLGERESASAAEKAELDSRKAALDSEKAALDGVKSQLDGAKRELDATGAALNQTETVLANEKAALDSGRGELEAAKGELNANRAVLDEGWSQYHSGVSELARQEKNIALNALTLEEAYRGIVDGEARYKQGLADYHSGKAEAEAELAAAAAKLEDAEGDVAAIEPAEWYVLDRDANMGFAGYRQDAERMEKLAAVFPLVFFLVAALVCLTGMTRMVEEQRVQIGALKALGYSKADISRKYVGYGFAASLVGGVLGLAIGATVIPWVIVDCWKVMYDYPGVKLIFDFPLALFCIALAVACCTVAVFAAVAAALREAPATLMRPKAPKAGKHIFLEGIPFFWKRLSFSRKVAFRNLFRYKKRFWMTVIGIAGCTCLLLTGFGLHNSIMDIIDLQYKNVSTYAAVLYTEDDLDEKERQDIYAALDQEGNLSDYAPCYLNTVTLKSSAYTLDGNLMAVDAPEVLDGFWDFHDRKTQKPVPLTDNAALISEKTAALLEVEPGDTVTLELNDKRYEMKIGGIIENYVGHYLVATKEYCDSALGFRPDNTQILLDYEDSADWETMGSRLIATDGVTGVYYQKESRDIVKNQLNGVYPAVIIIIAAAAALAFVVLFNLSSINLTERKRELATLRVLGLRDDEMRNYVLRENLILTVLGILLGIVCGNFFHAYLMNTIEVDLVMFGRSIHPLGYLLSIGLTLLFTLIVNAISGRSLAKIDMVESLKSIE